MCGIVGMAGNILLNHHKMFRDILILDAVRGMDSTGIVKVPLTEADPVQIDKEIGMPVELFQYGKKALTNEKGIMKGSSRVLIGHNRAATVGKVTVDNAHPFNFGHIYGVHNGSLTFWNDLVGGSGVGKHPVDSMAIFNTIEKKGIEETWKSFYGAAALVWWDNKDRQLNMIRNDKRPLHVVWQEDEKVLFWASELWMIIVAAQRNGIKLKRKEDKEIESMMLPVNTLFKFNPTATDCLFVSEEKLEEKKAFTAGVTNQQKKSTYHGGSEKTTNKKIYSGMPKRKRKGKMINVGWANGTLRSGRETRGLKICLTFCAGDGTRFIGRFEGSGPEVPDGAKNNGFIEVYPSTPADKEYIQEHMNRNKTIFVTKARLRYRISEQGNALWSVSSQGVIPHEEHKIKIEDEIPFDSPPPKYVKGYNNLYLTQKEWEKHYKECAWCSDPLSHKDAEHIHFIDNSSAICKDCWADGTVQTYLAH